MIKKAHGMTTERNSTSYEIKVYKTILFAQIKQGEAVNKHTGGSNVDELWLSIVGQPHMLQNLRILPKAVSKSKYPRQNLAIGHWKVFIWDCVFYPS